MKVTIQIEFTGDERTPFSANYKTAFPTIFSNRAMVSPSAQHNERLKGGIPGDISKDNYSITSVNHTSRIKLAIYHRCNIMT